MSDALIFMFVVLFFAVWAGAAYWVYTDAQKHSPHPPALWALVVFLSGIMSVFFGLVAILLYILLGRDTENGPRSRSPPAAPERIDD